nr:unnamed protein product [Callosobruchus analis]
MSDATENLPIHLQIEIVNDAEMAALLHDNTNTGLLPSIRHSNNFQNHPLNHSYTQSSIRHRSHNFHRVLPFYTILMIQS